MNRSSRSTQGPDHSDSGGWTLSIAEISRRTGVSPATLRAWEHRHDFPRPHRLHSGHRRYDESTVVSVQQVLHRRAAGVQLDVAIAEILAAARPQRGSVYAELRARHPELAVTRLRKATLVALSWAIEDEFCAKAAAPIVFGAFQTERRFETARARWTAMAPATRSMMVFADFPGLPGPDAEDVGGQGRAAPRVPLRVPLPPEAPMSREWAVVCDSVGLSAALTAWELPGQDGVADADRVFESMWTVEPHAVRSAARVCARVAQEAGASAAVPLLFELAADPLPGTTDLGSVTSMFNRVVAYVDSAHA